MLLQPCLEKYLKTLLNSITEVITCGLVMYTYQQETKKKLPPEMFIPHLVKEGPPVNLILMFVHIFQLKRVASEALYMFCQHTKEKERKVEYNYFNLHI